MATKRKRSVDGDDTTSSSSSSSTSSSSIPSNKRNRPSSSTSSSSSSSSSSTTTTSQKNNSNTPAGTAGLNDGNGAKSTFVVENGRRKKVFSGYRGFPIRLQNFVATIDLRCTLDLQGKTSCALILVVTIVRIVFISSFLFCCLLLKHSFQTNPNSMANCFKLILFLFTTTLLLRRYFDF